MDEEYILSDKGYFLDGNGPYYYMFKGTQTFTVRVYSGKKKELTGVGTMGFLKGGIKRGSYILFKSKEEVKAHLLKIELDRSL